MNYFNFDKYKKKYNILISILIVVFLFNVGFTIANKDKYRAKSIPGTVDENVGFVPAPITAGDKKIANKVIEFKDANLEHIIRYNLSNFDKKIHIKDVRGISYLNLNHCDIVNLEGLQYFKNLHKLDVSFNNIKDVSVLSKLKNLQELIAYNNDISDATGASKILSLRKLDISNNKIVDVSPIVSLVNLKELDINNNQIKDISKLDDMKGLTSLDISRNSIKDISPLKDMHYKLFLDWGNNIE